MHSHHIETSQKFCRHLSNAHKKKKNYIGREPIQDSAAAHSDPQTSLIVMPVPVHTSSRPSGRYSPTMASTSEHCRPQMDCPTANSQNASVLITLPSIAMMSPSSVPTSLSRRRVASLLAPWNSIL